MGRKKGQGWLERAVNGVAEAAYPPGHKAPDYRATEMAGRMKAYIGGLPPATARQLRLLYFFIEYLSHPIARRLGRFSEMKIERRRAALEAWSNSKFYYLRLLGDAVKANLTMLYLSHPAVLAYLGHYKNCLNKADAFEVKIKRGALGDWKPKKRKVSQTAAPRPRAKKKRGPLKKTAPRGRR